jgi:hypothetical protein
MSADKLDVEAIAEEAYIYLYPLVLMDVTRKVMTNVVEPKGTSAPVGQFAHFRKFPELTFKAVVRPNFDTLYSSLHMDLTKEPMILSLPDSKGRYYLAPVLSMWTDVIASPGWRTTGTGAGNYGFVPPGWTGTLPDGVVRVEAETPYVWMIGRTKAEGADDYPAVHAFQDGMKIAPLSQWGKDWKAPDGKVDPSIDMKTAPLAQVRDMSAKEFFEYAAELMKLHPPKTTDYSQVWRMERIGIIPGKDLAFDSLDASVQGELQKARKEAYARIKAKTANLGALKNGWQLLLGTVGSYGIEYLQRAGVDLAGLGCNQLADAYYPLLAENIGPTSDTYTMHFDKGKTPPAKAFWSYTLYDDDGFAVPNSLNRGNLSSWMDLAYNSDGSLDLYMGPTSPGKDKESNWLPAPSDKAWNLTLRLYAPEEAAREGTWVPPPVTKAS